MTAPDSVTCRSGRHSWLQESDAQRCCNPDWQRVLVSTQWGDRLQDGDRQTAVRGLWVRWVRRGEG